MTHSVKSIALVIMLGLASFNLYSQCSTPPAAGSCSGGNGAVTNGQNINSGNVYWHSAGSGTLAGININGGTLRICGNLTLSSININSGTILIEQGGSLTINGGSTLNLNGNVTISNRGTLNINRNVTMQNSNNYLYNASANAVINMNSGLYTLELNSSTSRFINNGTANIYSVFIQGSASAGCICMGPSSTANFSLITNNYTNSVTVGSGLACIRYTGIATFNNNLTNSSALSICRAATALKLGFGTFGSATVNYPCASCLIALPVDFASFNAEYNNGDIDITWSTATETNNHFFTIEASTDNENFKEVTTVEGNGNSNTLSDYSYTFSNIREILGNIQSKQLIYIRIKQTDYNDAAAYSNTVTVQTAANHKIEIYPNPVQNLLNISNSAKSYNVEISNLVGQVFVSGTYSGSAQINTESLMPGFYLVYIKDISGNILTQQKLVKE